MKAATTQLIASLLKDAAGAMRSLLKETAISGNSDDLQTIAGWISEVEGLTARVHPGGEASPTVKKSSLEKPAAQVMPRRPPMKAEARFEREGDTLIKIAWSKKNKSEYEHKASREALAAVVDRVEDRGRRGRMFRMEDMLPILLSDGSELPSYQAYLCIGWLKSEGLLEQHGRQGYTVAANITMKSEVERGWADLRARGE